MNSGQRCCTDADNGWEPDEIPATLYLDASRPRLGKRHLAVFPGSAAALIALALTPTARRPVAEGVAGLRCVGRLALGSPRRRSRVDGDLGVRLAVRAHALRRHGLAAGCIRALLHRLDRERSPRPGSGRPFASPLLARPPQRRPALTVGGIAGSLSAVRAMWLLPSCSHWRRRAVCCPAGRSRCSCSWRGGGRNRVARA